MDDNILDGLLYLFSKHDTYISEDLPSKNGKEPTEEQLKMINIMEHNRLEAYFKKYFPDEEYKNMPFYELAQNLNVRKPHTPKNIIVDIQKRLNTIFIEITTSLLIMPPETIELLHKSKGSVMFSFFKSINQAALSFSIPISPDDETTKKE